MSLKPLVEVLASASRTTDGSVKYPLDCGCTSHHEHNMCAEHKAERLDDMRRLMGIPKLTFNHRDFTDLPSLAKALHAIKLQLIANPTKSLLIKIIPGDKPNEADAS